MTNEATLHRCAPRWACRKEFHRCYGTAVMECEESDNGELWVSNIEYETRVNFCPFCGYRSTNPVEGEK